METKIIGYKTNDGRPAVLLQKPLAVGSDSEILQFEIEKEQELNNAGRCVVVDAIIISKIKTHATL